MRVCIFLFSICLLTSTNAQTISDCVDDSTFVDRGNFTCLDWSYDDCTAAVEQYASQYGYTESDQEEILNKCKKSCGLCGEFPCLDRKLNDSLIWRDSYNDTCVKYKLNEWCGLYGDTMLNGGYTANKACCTCGGGTEPPIDCQYVYGAMATCDAQCMTSLTITQASRGQGNACPTVGQTCTVGQGLCTGTMFFGSKLTPSQSLSNQERQALELSIKNKMVLLFTDSSNVEVSLDIDYNFPPFVYNADITFDAATENNAPNTTSIATNIELAASSFNTNITAVVTATTGPFVRHNQICEWTECCPDGEQVVFEIRAAEGGGFLCNPEVGFSRSCHCPIISPPTPAPTEEPMAEKFGVTYAIYRGMICQGNGQGFPLKLEGAFTPEMCQERCNLQSCRAFDFSKENGCWLYYSSSVEATDEKPGTVCYIKSDCIDVPGFRDHANFTCNDWKSYDCNSAAEMFGSELGYKHSDVLDIVQNCKASCGLCASECIDDPAFLDSAGYNCSEWNDEFGCASAAGVLGFSMGYSDLDQLELMNKCKKSCRVCNPCQDMTLYDGSPWKNSNSETCNDYEEKSLCPEYGNMVSDHGYSANTACCVCGGGHAQVCIDQTQPDGSPWEDVGGALGGDTCDDYKDSGWCSVYGDKMGNHGATANQACCACGGGAVLELQQCKDDLKFKDRAGFPCTEWAGGDCMSVVETYGTKYGYTADDERDILDRCRESCRVCGEGAARNGKLGGGANNGWIAAVVVISCIIIIVLIFIYWRRTHTTAITSPEGETVEKKQSEHEMDSFSS